MLAQKFRAYSVTNEINLNRIALECGISKKYTWEEPLTLQDGILENILGTPVETEQKAMLFSFGSIVLINLPSEICPALLHYLKKFGTVELSDWQNYTDDYALHISENEQTDADENTQDDGEEERILTDEYAVIKTLESFYPGLVADVLAKSVALERVETQLGKILDSLESFIERLEKGKVQIGDKKLAKVTARVVRHEFNSISYIMILDKPDITWANSQAGEFYHDLSEFFELNDRYEIIKSKAAVSNNIITGFSSISHAFRGLRVELIILLLIVIEVVLMILEFLR